jgi:predicted secreted protein
MTDARERALALVNEVLRIEHFEGEDWRNKAADLIEKVMLAEWNAGFNRGYKAKEKEYEAKKL